MLITITGGKAPFSIFSMVTLSRSKCDHDLVQLVLVRFIQLRGSNGARWVVLPAPLVAIGSVSEHRSIIPHIVTAVKD